MSYKDDDNDNESHLLIDRIKNIANDVIQKLGCYHSESVYQQAMEVGLREVSIPYEAQKIIPINYHGIQVGFHRLDFLVDRKIIVELKVAGKVSTSREQVMCYIDTMGVDYIGLIIYFYPTLHCYVVDKNQENDQNRKRIRYNEDDTSDYIQIPWQDN